MQWTAEIELDVRMTSRTEGQLAEAWLEALADYHPVVTRSSDGHGAVIITLPAESLRQAQATALAVVESATGRRATAAAVMAADKYGIQSAAVEIPDLVSVTEAADMLGATRQAVLQRIDAGTLAPATRIGNTWAISQTAVEQLLAKLQAE